MQHNRREAADTLIPRIATGDRAAFDSLFRAMADWLLAVCLKLLNDRPRAEAAVQAVFQRVMAEAGQHSGSGLSGLAWLVAVARAEALAARDGGTASLPPPIGGDVIAADAARLREVLATLPEAEATAFRAAALTGAAPDPAALDAALRTIAAAPEPEIAAETQAARAALGLPGGESPPDPARLKAWHERIAVIADEVTPVLIPARVRLNLDRALGHALPSDMGEIVIRGRGRPSSSGGGRFWIILLAVLVLGATSIILWPQFAP